MVDLVFERVGHFHRLGGYAHVEDGPPVLMDRDQFEFRRKFILEELAEFEEAYNNNDLIGVADAIGDLIIVAMGAAHYCHIPLDSVLHAIMTSNLAKEPQSTDRGEQDFVKPDGWQGPEPQIAQILLHHGRKFKLDESD